MPVGVVASVDDPLVVGGVRQVLERDAAVRRVRGCPGRVACRSLVASELRGTPDTPFAHEMARAAGTDHQAIVLDSKQFADPEVRSQVIRARDIPMGLVDLDPSLYMLFKGVRQHSTVVLSGESADEVFGGYRQFFDPVAREADTFPWLVKFAKQAGDDGIILTSDAVRALDPDGFIRDSYQSAVSGVQRLDSESDFEFRMRKICYLHLTRFVRTLLDRKDRVSMAVGPEVRVPFCDHRLVEYVYNTPWSMKSFDGREKSLCARPPRTSSPAPYTTGSRAPTPPPRTPATPRGSSSTCRTFSPSPPTRSSTSSAGTGPSVSSRPTRRRSAWRPGARWTARWTWPSGWTCTSRP